MMNWYTPPRTGRRLPIRRTPLRPRYKRAAAEAAQEKRVDQFPNGNNGIDDSIAAAERRFQNGSNGRVEAPTPTVETPTEPAPVSRGRIERLDEAGTDWRATVMRLQADMENFKRRQSRRADQSTHVERERLLKQFLPVIDNLGRALNHEGQDEATLRQGLELVYRQLNRLFEMEGVSKIEAAGQAFNPQHHDAVAVLDSAAESGTVVEEIEAGYTLDDKLLRPARVVVAS